MPKPDPPNLAEAFTDAIELAAAPGRDDLIARAIDELWLIFRYPAERFPEGPPPETVEAMRAAREARYPSPSPGVPA